MGTRCWYLSYHHKKTNIKGTISDKAAAELIGTAILLFTIQVSVGQNAALAPLAIGGILVAIVFAGG